MTTRAGKGKNFLDIITISSEEDTEDDDTEATTPTKIVSEPKARIKKEPSSPDGKHNPSNTSSSSEKQAGRTCAMNSGGEKLEPECILGVAKVAGKIRYLLKYKDCQEVELLFSDDIIEKCPHLAVQFFEKRLVWK